MIIYSTSINDEYAKLCMYHIQLLLDDRINKALQEVSRSNQISLNLLEQILEREYKYKRVAQEVIGPLLRSKFLLVNEISYLTVGHNRLSKLRDLCVSIAEITELESQNLEHILKAAYQAIKCLALHHRLRLLEVIANQGGFAKASKLIANSHTHTMAHVNDFIKSKLVYKSGDNLKIDTYKLDLVVEAIKKYVLDR